MENHILNAAVAFQKLLSVKYRIVLGKKGKSIEICLAFHEDNFYHLTGFQHLKQYHFNKISKNEFFDRVLLGIINDETVGNYVSNPDILARVKSLSRLEILIDDPNALFFQYDKKRVNFPSNLNANYVMKNHLNDTPIIFSFFVNGSIDKNSNRVEYRFNSIFPLTRYDFTKRQAQYTVLLKEKILNDETITLYKNPNYKLPESNN